MVLSGLVAGQCPQFHNHVNAIKSEGDGMKVKEVVTHKELFNTTRHLLAMGNTTNNNSLLTLILPTLLLLVMTVTFFSVMTVVMNVMESAMISQ